MSLQLQLVSLGCSEVSLLSSLWSHSQSLCTRSSQTGVNAQQVLRTQARLILSMSGWYTNVSPSSSPNSVQETYNPPINLFIPLQKKKTPHLEMLLLQLPPAKPPTTTEEKNEQNTGPVTTTQASTLPTDRALVTKSANHTFLPVLFWPHFFLCTLKLTARW